MKKIIIKRMKSDEEASMLPDEDCDTVNATSNKMHRTEGNRQSKAKAVKGAVNEVVSLTSEEGRDFISKIKETCLDPIHNERFWRIESLQRIRNTTLEKKYEDKRKSDLVSKQDGQEIFVFSVESHKLCKEIANDGYRVGLKRKHILGYADSGVHLVRHYDILTRYMAYQLFTGTQKIIVSKAFLGKAKAVEPYMLQNDNYHSPDSSYDCHYSTITTHKSMPILEAISCSYMYFYELDPVSSNNVKHPRQILPFAVMTLTKKPRVRPIEPFLAVDTGDVHTGWEVSGETRHGFRFKYNKSTQRSVESRSTMIERLKQERHKLNRRLRKFQKQTNVEDISADDKSSLLQMRIRRNNIEHVELEQLKMNDPDVSKCNLAESQGYINVNPNTKDNTSDIENCASNINNVQMTTLSRNVEKSKGIKINFNGQIYDVSIPPLDRTVSVKHAHCNCTPKIGMCMAQIRAHSAPYRTKCGPSYTSQYENWIGAVTKSKPTQNKLTASRSKFQNRVCKYLPISYRPFVLLNDVHRVDITKARLTHLSQEVSEKHINKEKVIHTDSLLNVSEINKETLANTSQTLNNALIAKSVSKSIEVKQFQQQNVTNQVTYNTPELNDKAQCNESVQFVSKRASKQNRSNETSNRLVTGGSKFETISGEQSKVSSCMEKTEERKHNERHGTTNEQNVPTSQAMLKTSAETSTLISNLTKTNIEGNSHTEHVGLTENVSHYHNEIQSLIQSDLQKSDNTEFTLAIADNDTVVQQKLANTTHMIDQTPAPIHLLSHNTCEHARNPPNRYITDSKEYCTDNYVNKTETSSIVEASSASDSYDSIVTTTFHNSIPDNSDEKQSAITVTIEPEVNSHIFPKNDADCLSTNNLNVGTVYVGDKRNDMHVAPKADTIGFVNVVPTYIDFGQKADDVCVMTASYKTQENKQMLLKCLSDRKRLNKRKSRSKDSCLSLHDHFTQQIHALDFSKSKRNQNPNYPKPIDSDPKVLPKDTRLFRLNPAEITNEPLNLTQESFIRDKQTHSFHNIETNECHSQGSTSERNITSNIVARSHLKNDITPTITDDQQAIVNANEAADRWEMTKTAIADISRSTDCVKSELTLSPRLSDPLMFQNNDPCSIPSFERITSQTHDRCIPIGAHTIHANLNNVFTHNVITSRVPISTHTCNGRTPSNVSNSSPRLISSLVQYRFPSPSQSPIQSPSPVPCHAMNVGLNIRHPHIATVPTIPYPMHLEMCSVTSTHMSADTTVCTSTGSKSMHVGLGTVLHSNNMEAISSSGVTSDSTYLDGYRGVVGGDKSNTKVDVETAKRLQKFLLKSISAVKKQSLLGIPNGTHNSGQNDSDAFSQANYSFSNLPTIVTSLDNSFEKPISTKLTEISFSPTFVSENNHCSPNTNTSLSASIISETVNECRKKLSPFPITETEESFSGTSEKSPLTTVKENIAVLRPLSVNQKMIDTTQCHFSQISELQTILPMEEDTFLRNSESTTQTSAAEESFSQIGKTPILKSINGHSFSMHAEEIEQMKIEEHSENMIMSDYVHEHPSELDVMPILYNETEIIDENVSSFQNFPDPPNIHDDDSQETVIGGISLATYRNNAHYPKFSELISVVENGSLDIINTVKIHKRRCTQFNNSTSKQISISGNRQKSTTKKKVIKTAISKKLSTKFKRYKYRQSLKHKGHRFKHRTFNKASKCEHDTDINNCVDQPDFTALKEFSSIANMVANSASGSVTIEDILTSTTSNGISNASITNSDDGNTHLPNLTVKHPDFKTQRPLVCHSSSAAIPIQHTSELSQSSDQQLNDACENNGNIHIDMSLNDNINESSIWRRVNACKLPVARKESDTNKLQGKSQMYAETENTIDHEHIKTNDSIGVCKHETVQTITAVSMEEETFDHPYPISNVQTNTNQQISGSLRNGTSVNDYTSDTVTSLGSCALPEDVTATVTDTCNLTNVIGYDIGLLRERSSHTVSRTLKQKSRSSMETQSAIEIAIPHEQLSNNVHLNINNNVDPYMNVPHTSNIPHISEANNLTIDDTCTAMDINAIQIKQEQSGNTGVNTTPVHSETATQKDCLLASVHATTNETINVYVDNNIPTEQEDCILNKQISTNEQDLRMSCNGITENDQTVTLDSYTLNASTTDADIETFKPAQKTEYESRSLSDSTSNNATCVLKLDPLSSEVSDVVQINQKQTSTSVNNAILFDNGDESTHAITTEYVDEPVDTEYMKVISSASMKANEHTSRYLSNGTLITDYTSGTEQPSNSNTNSVVSPAIDTWPFNQPHEYASNVLCNHSKNNVTDVLKTPDSLSSMETKQMRQLSELTNKNINLDVSLYDTVDMQPSESGVNINSSKASENKTSIKQEQSDFAMEDIPQIYPKIVFRQHEKIRKITGHSDSYLDIQPVAIEIHNYIDNMNNKNKAVENDLSKINSKKCEIQCHVPSDNLRNVDINSYVKYSKSNPTQLAATNDTLLNINTIRETNTELEQANNTYISMHNEKVDTNNTDRKQTSKGTINLKAIKETLSLPRCEKNTQLSTSIKHRRRDITYDICPIIQSNSEKSGYIVETARADSKHITKAVKLEYFDNEDERWLDKTNNINVTVLPHSESHRNKTSVSSSNYSDGHTSRYYRKRHRHSLSDYKYRDIHVFKDKSDNVQNKSDKGVYSPKEKNAPNPANVRSSSFPIDSEKTTIREPNQSVAKSDEQVTSYKARHVEKSHSNVKDKDIKRTAKDIKSFDEIIAEKRVKYDEWKRSRKWKTMDTSDGDPFKQNRHTYMCNSTLKTDYERTRRNISDRNNSEYVMKVSDNNERALTRLPIYDQKSRLSSPGDDFVDLGKRSSLLKSVDKRNKDKKQRKSGDITQLRSSKFGTDMSTFSKGLLTGDASQNNIISTEKYVLSRTQDCVNTLNRDNKRTKRSFDNASFYQRKCNTSICEPKSGKLKTYIESNSLIVSSNDGTYYPNKKQMDRKTHAGKFTFPQEDATSVPDKELCHVSRSNEEFVDKGFDASNYKVDDGYPFRQIRKKHYSYQSRKMIPTRKNCFQNCGTGYFQWRRKYCRQGPSSLHNGHNDEIQEGNKNGRTRETLRKKTTSALVEQKLVFRKERDNCLGDKKIARYIAELRRLIRQRQNQTLHKNKRRVLVELEMLSRNTNPGKRQRISKWKLKRKLRTAKPNRHLKREDEIILNCLNVQSKGRQRTELRSWVIQKADKIKDIFTEDLRQQCDQVTEPFKRGMSNQSVGNSLVQNISTELSYTEPRTNIAINSRKNYDNEIEPSSRVADHKHVYNTGYTSTSDCLSSSAGVSKHSAQNSAISQRGWCHRHCALETNGVNVANEPDDTRRSRSEDRYTSFYRHAKEHNSVPYERRSWSPEHIEIKHGMYGSHRSDVCGPNGDTFDNIHYDFDSRNSNKYRRNPYTIRSESASSFMWENKEVNIDGSQFRQHYSPDQQFRQSKSNKWTHVDDARDTIEPYDTYCQRYKLYRHRRLDKHNHYSNKDNSGDSEYLYSGR